MKKYGTNWQYHVGQWQESGLSKAEYCRQVDVCVSSFYAFFKRTAKNINKKEIILQKPISSQDKQLSQKKSYDRNLDDKVNQEKLSSSFCVVQVPNQKIAQAFQTINTPKVTKDQFDNVSIRINLNGIYVEVVPKFCQRTLQQVLSVLEA